MDLRLVGIKSTHGFKAMYKTMQPILYIQSIMDNVLQAAPVTVSTQSLAPRFICASPDAGQKYMLDLDPWARCLEDSPTSYSSFWVEGTAIVMVCPAFFSLRLVPPIGPGAPGDLYCPIVHNNQFIGQSDPLIRYQNYDLLREMVRMYMGGYALGPETRPKEVMDWNECVGLRPYRSCAWNVMNLVYYTACESSTSPSLKPRGGGLTVDEQSLSKGALNFQIRSCRHFLR